MKYFLLLMIVLITSTSFNIEPRTYYIGTCLVQYTDKDGVKCEDQMPRLILAKNPSEAAALFEKEVKTVEARVNGHADRDSSVYRVWNVPFEKILRN